jgi:peptide deformylase
MTGSVDPEETFEVEPEEDAERGELELDPEVAARRAAALLRVRKFGDPVLRTRARPLAQVDDTLRSEVQHMGQLMGDALGVGLAATQLGVLHRVLVYRVQQQAPVAALVNPEIEWSGRELETMEEGCLSLPGALVDVERPVHVRVRALDQRGDQIVVEASGLEARVIQHEIDHLDGVLILDRTTREQRKEAIRALREAEQAA